MDFVFAINKWIKINTCFHASKPFNACAGHHSGYYVGHLNGHHSGRDVSGHSSPAAIARELFKPSTDAASLLVSIKKNFWFGFGVLLGWLHKAGVFLNFWPILTGPGRQPNESFFWFKLFVKTGLSSASSEPFIDLLACLEPKLWLKHPILPPNQNIAEKAWVSHWRLEQIAITRRENMIESYSNPRKTREAL